MSRRNREQRATAIDRTISMATLNTPIAPLEVKDPYDGGRLIVARSLRDDPLARLHDRHHIDDAQYAAGRAWQALYEAAEIGGARAIDPTREPVDGGGRIPEPITDRQRHAVRELGRLGRALGEQGDALVRDVLGRRLFIEQAAARREQFSRDAIEYLGKRFRECLETLARNMGFAA